LFVVVVTPVSPEGARDTGIYVEPGITTNGDPDMVVVENWPSAAGLCCWGSEIVVGEGMMMKGVLFMVVVLPVTPAGALATGIVVGAGIVTGCGWT
jgi:hypothetical protein